MIMMILMMIKIIKIRSRSIIIRSIRSDQDLSGRDSARARRRSDGTTSRVQVH